MTVLEHGRNRGTAAACNTGIKWALQNGAEYVGIFNNDMKYHPRWVRMSLDVLAAHPDAAMLGFTVIGDGVRGDEDEFERICKTLKSPRVWRRTTSRAAR